MSLTGLIPALRFGLVVSVRNSRVGVESASSPTRGRAISGVPAARQVRSMSLTEEIPALRFGLVGSVRNRGRDVTTISSFLSPIKC
ncbi:MAG TPA: hypothetical protein PLI18_14050, partial [Pirellulaceae bacterium]|nr:hypothetical protein [Pirellulaceae bacterium]